MTRTYLPPDQARQIADLDRRLANLERRIRSAGAAIDNSFEIVFSYAAALTASASPPVRVRRAGNLAVLAFTFDTPGSTDTTVDVIRNGNVAATVVVPDSVETYNGLIGIRYDADDQLSLEITTAGTGASDMTAGARFT